MTLLSARRAVPALASVAALAAMALPGVAHATEPKTDVSEQCSGAQKIEGEGSTFQGPAQFKWTGYNFEKKEHTSTGFNFELNALTCNGTAEAGKRTAQKPEVIYNQTNPLERGSGSCLKTWGSGVKSFGEEKEEKGSKDKYPRVSRYPYCGTDEAPTATVENEFEAYAEPGVESRSIETIPVAQGAVAVIVNLPAGCTATSEPVVKGITKKRTILSLDRSTVEGIYRGTIKTWKQALEAQGTDGRDALHCKEASAEEDTIRPVVRADKSGTTHIFKEFLAQVNTAKFTAEEFNEINGSKNPCGVVKTEEEKTWQEVAEGCENQRWPKAANVLRPTESGNPGVVHSVEATPSSIGYADLAVAREIGGFSTKGVGGENKAGEANQKFWTEIQNTADGATTEEFAEPSSNGDKAGAGASNCKSTVYANQVGEKFPPANTREDWSQVKGLAVSKTYAICGLTYDLAARQYWYYLEKYGLTEEESKAIATTVHDFLHYVVNTKTGGGGKLLSKIDYEALPSAVQKEAELGAEEIGSKIG